MNPSTAIASVLVDELIANGVTDAVLAPGSRNAPLSMALAAADAAGRLRLHVRIDERTAGFLALGLARGSGRPAVVVTTSGTAVANLHPAVLEANHGGVPLLLLTADRPPRLRDVGANQTVDQTRLFGPALRFFHEFGVGSRLAGQQAGWRAMTCRALAHCTGVAGAAAGPVQLNVPFDEPLLPDGDDGWPEDLTGVGSPWTSYPASYPTSHPAAGAAVTPVAAPEPGERVLFVADLTHPAAAGVARAGHPVVSEAGGLAGSAVLAAGIPLLATPSFVSAQLPERVVVLGRPTLFRAVSALLARTGVVIDVVAEPALAADPAGRVRTVSPALAAVTEPADADWLDRWRTADRAATAAIATVVDDTDIASSPALAAALTRSLPTGSTLVLGSSQVPRDIGQFSAARDGVRVVANRGVSGIDGTVSTAVGVALTTDQTRAATAGPTFAHLGDLTLLHDLTGLVIGPHEPRPDLTFVVSNNDGGGIFGTLEPGEARHAGSFERVFGTPHGVALAQVAEGLGVEHLLITTADELADAIAEPAGLRIVEVPTSRTDLRELSERVRAVVAAAVG